MPILDHRIVDCHGHIGHFEGYDLSISTLHANLDRHRIDLVLISNIDGAAVSGKTLGLDETEANRATRNAVYDDPERLRGLLWGRPDRGDASGLEEFLEDRVTSRFWTERTFVGLKLHPEMNAFPADDPCVDPYLTFAAEAGLPVVFHCDGQVDHASPERIARLAARHPEVPVVLYHMGFQGPHEPAIRMVERSVDTGSSRLYLECSQADPEAVIDAIGRVGIERMLFGTDATFFGACHYEAYEALVRTVEAKLSTSDLDRFFFSNSVSLFDLRASELNPPENLHES